MVGGSGIELSRYLAISLSPQHLESLHQRNLNGLFAILDFSSKNLSVL